LSAQIVRDQTEVGKFTLLSIDANHVLALSELPLHHNDPFDRLLIAQARTESARLVTTDRAMRDYSAQVQLLW
jgi:PIN domain nuclease of toxin-antitoxin system